MNVKNIKRIHRITALIFVASIIFFLFFQVNKRSPLVEANPFAVRSLRRSWVDRDSSGIVDQHSDLCTGDTLAG